MISPIERSDENPAACRCPPPPDARAIAETSTSSWRGAQRDPAGRPLVARRLADERDHLGAFDRAEVVDDPLGVRLLGADVPEVVLEEVRHDEPPSLEELRALECACEQLQLRELHRLVDVLEDAVHVGPGLDELGGEPQRLRCRVRVLEAAGVGDEPT